MDRDLSPPPTPNIPIFSYTHLLSQLIFPCEGGLSHPGIFRAGHRSQMAVLPQGNTNPVEVTGRPISSELTFPPNRF